MRTARNSIQVTVTCLEIIFGIFDSHQNVCKLVWSGVSHRRGGRLTSIQRRLHTVEPGSRVLQMLRQLLQTVEI